LLALSSLEALGASVASLARSHPRPYTVLFADAGYLSLLVSAGFHAPLSPVQGESGIVLVSFEGDPAEVHQGQDSLSGVRGRELPAEMALTEWSLRLYHLRAKRAGPSLLAAEMWLPLRYLTPYLQAVDELARRSRQVIGTYGLAVTPDLAQVMSIYPADERRELAYLAAIGFTKRLYDLGARFAGKPYGVGLWNTPYLSRLFSRSQLSELRRRKARLDPAGIMNPGKLYAASFPLWPVTFAPGAALLAAAHSIARKRTP
jgi:glycolate oxidase